MAWLVQRILVDGPLGSSAFAVETYRIAALGIAAYWLMKSWTLVIRADGNRTLKRAEANKLEAEADEIRAATRRKDRAAERIDDADFSGSSELHNGALAIEVRKSQLN
jgi:hypothetical protein